MHILYWVVNHIGQQLVHANKINRIFTWLAFSGGNRWWPMDSPHNEAVIRETFQCLDVIMILSQFWLMSITHIPITMNTGSIRANYNGQTVLASFDIPHPHPHPVPTPDRDHVLDALRNLGTVSIQVCRLTIIGIPMLKIRRSHDRLIFNMGIPIPGKDGLYIDTGPWTQFFS